MVSISRIVTQNVLGHDAVDLALPGAGIVTIQGPNGAGKSSVVEAVAAALWGKTLRGEPWQVDGATSIVRLETSLATVERERSKRTNVLAWAPPGEPLRSYETATKAQAELDSVVGDMEAWRRTSVFSSQDVLSFSLATDAERKRLIEGMLGLGVFDVGLLACRKDKIAADRVASKLRGDLREAKAHLEGHRGRLALAQATLGPEPPQPQPARLQALQEALAASKRELRAAEATATASGAKAQRLAAEAKRRAAALQAVATLAACPSCGQGLTDGARQHLEKGDRAAMEAAAQGGAEAATEAATADELVEELEEEVEALATQVQQLREQAVAHKEWTQRRDFQRDQAEAVQQDVTAAEQAVQALEADIAAADLAAEELKAVEQVLGLRGVRAQVIAGALGGLESVANAWLDRLMPGASIGLRPDSDLAKGGTVEKISLDVFGMGHSRGYRACSGGERRRIDVALVLALAEVHSAAHGGAKPTLFMDEIFDTLDPAGVAGVAAALTDVAADRCVVVITHNDDLADSLDAVARWSFNNGVATGCP